MELFLWNTSIRGTPLFRGHKIWSRKKVHIIFVFITSIEGTRLFRGKRKGHFFWVPKTGFKLHSGDTLDLKKWLTTNIVKGKIICLLANYYQTPYQTSIQGTCYFWGHLPWSRVCTLKRGSTVISLTFIGVVPSPPIPSHLPATPWPNLWLLDCAYLPSVLPRVPILPLFQRDSNWHNHTT